MLQNKDINKISELKNGFTPRWLEPDFILGSLKCFSVGRGKTVNGNTGKDLK